MDIWPQKLRTAIVINVSRLLGLLRYVKFMHTYTRTQIECVVENCHLVWRNVTKTFHLNFILFCNALFLAPFSDEVNVIYFVTCAYMYYAFMYSAEAELQLCIYVATVVSHAAFLKVSFIYVYVD
jgi:hypothetical protein